MNTMAMKGNREYSTYKKRDLTPMKKVYSPILRLINGSIREKRCITLEGDYVDE